MSYLIRYLFTFEPFSFTLTHHVPFLQQSLHIGEIQKRNRYWRMNAHPVCFIYRMTRIQLIGSRLAQKLADKMHARTWIRFRHTIHSYDDTNEIHGNPNKCNKKHVFIIIYPLLCCASFLCAMFLFFDSTFNNDGKFETGKRRIKRIYCVNKMPTSHHWIPKVSVSQ